MPYVIIRGNNGRRHEVDFEDADITVEFHSNGDTVEFVIEARDDDRPWEKKRFALINLPRAAFDQAVAEQARTKRATFKAVE